MSSSDFQITYSPEEYPILVASIEKPVQRLCQVHLEKVGFPVTTCSSGLEVLAYFEANPPTYLVIDEQLEELDGLGTIHRLYDNPRFRRFPFLFLKRTWPGAWPMWATRHDIYGAVTFLDMVFHPDELTYFVKSRIQAMLNGKWPLPEADFPFPPGVTYDESRPWS